MVAFMTLLGGFLSFFSGGINTVFPMLAPIVGTAVAGTAIKPVTMFIGILLGACYTALSPFSTGGAIFMSNCQDEKVRGKLITWQLGLAVLGMGASAVLAAVGILASIIGTFFVKGDENANPHKALKTGSYTAAILVAIVSVILSKTCFGNMKAAIAVIAGLIVGQIIGIITEIYTSGDYKSVKKIADQSETGPATTIISGLAVGMESTERD